MRYSVNGRPQSVITALVALLLAVAVQFIAGDRPRHPHMRTATAAATAVHAGAAVSTVRSIDA